MTKRQEVEDDKITSSPIIYDNAKCSTTIGCKITDDAGYSSTSNLQRAMPECATLLSNVPSTEFELAFNKNHNLSSSQPHIVGTNAT